VIELHNVDCMELMKRYPDNYFNLSIVDPPYGIGEASKPRPWRGGGQAFFHETKNWDKKRPEAGYFNSLLRVSKNCIIWGGNYYADLLPASKAWVFWNKKTVSNLADGELAYTTFNCTLKMFSYKWEGYLQEDMKNKEQRIHPTQKPIALYRWLLDNYAKQGDKILDTHLGSGSSAIAAYQLGYNFVGCELDKDYFKAMEKRVKQAMKQTNLFQSVEEKQAEQIKIF